MGDNGPEFDTGSKDRATVALVDAKVDGLRELLRAEFANVREDIKPLAGIVLDVAKLRLLFDDHERRLNAVESKAEAKAKGDREYRRVHLPALVFAGLAALASVVTLLITQLH